MGKELHEHADDKRNNAGYRPFRLREVQYGEFAVISSGGPVVGFGRQDLIIEVAEVYRLAVKANTSLPAPFLTSPCNALVFGTEGSVLSFRLISGVLREN